MARGSDDGGCGCLLVIILAFVFGGGFWGGVGILAGGWLAYLVFIGVSVGIVIAIVKAIAGE
jgi:hypothetical protein